MNALGVSKAPGHSTLAAGTFVEVELAKNSRILCASANFSGPLAQVVSGWMVRG